LVLEFKIYTTAKLHYEPTTDFSEIHNTFPYLDRKLVEQQQQGDRSDYDIEGY